MRYSGPFARVFLYMWSVFYPEVGATVTCHEHENVGELWENLSVREYWPRPEPPMLTFAVPELWGSEPLGPTSTMLPCVEGLTSSSKVIPPVRGGTTHE